MRALNTEPIDQRNKFRSVNDSVRGSWVLTAGKASVPDDVYFSQIDALHEDVRSFVLASGAVFLTGLLVAFVAQSMFLLSFTFFLPLTTAFRVRRIGQYSRARPEIATREQMRVWEVRYAIGSTIQVGWFGLWCLATFYVTDDPFCRFATMSTCMAYLLGVPGRNFAAGPLVVTQLLVGLLPICVALALAGGRYPMLIPFGIVPTGLCLNLIAVRLRKLLLGPVLSSRENALIAGRFDAALNNMPHGLWMFDQDGGLVVANGAGPEILRTEPLPAATPIRDVFFDLARTGLYTRNDMNRLLAGFESRRRKGSGEIIEFDSADGRHLAFTIRPTPDGGTIVLVEDITARKKVESAIHDLARYDPLTRLINRSVFESAVKEALERMGWRNESIAVLFVDLDNFKGVNDALGHQRGDDLLRKVAEKLQSIVRETDIVARFGGDEFVILQTRVHKDFQTENLARRIISELSLPVVIEGHSVVAGASVGIAMAPRDGGDVASLLKNADMALYSAKGAGRGCLRFFDKSMDEQLHARRVLEQDIRAALANGWFEVHFQPIIKTRTRTLKGAEALMRLNHPHRGPISPVQFISVMEELGLIAEAGALVLERACRECAKWPRHLSVAVNVSPHQIKRGDIGGVVRNALRVTGLDPFRLELEITESAFLERGPETLAALDELRSLGVRISLDDFGTGYSSLSCLHEFPIDKLKIDRSFLLAIETSARGLVLFRSIAQLSRNLGLEVVVEGVETEMQMALVVAEGNVDQVQGFLFSKAVPALDFQKMIDAESGMRRAS